MEWVRKRFCKTKQLPQQKTYSHRVSFVFELPEETYCCCFSKSQRYAKKIRKRVRTYLDQNVSPSVDLHVGEQPSQLNGLMTWIDVVCTLDTDTPNDPNQEWHVNQGKGVLTIVKDITKGKARHTNTLKGYRGPPR